MIHDPDRPNAIDLTDAQLHAFERGWAVTIMPARDAWKLHYFSVPQFDDRPGTVFPSIDAALAAVAEVLPAINADEQRTRARAEQKRRDTTGDDEGRHLP